MTKQKQTRRRGAYKRVTKVLFGALLKGSTSRLFATKPEHKDDKVLLENVIFDNWPKEKREDGRLYFKHIRRMDSNE